MKFQPLATTALSSWWDCKRSSPDVTNKKHTDQNMGGFLKWFSPQIIHLFIGFSIIFTIHFGVFPLFLENTHIEWMESLEPIHQNKAWDEMLLF